MPAQRGRGEPTSGSGYREWPPRRGRGGLEARCVAWLEEFTTCTHSCWRGARELAASLGWGGKPERNAKTGTTQGGQAGEGALMEARSPWLPWWEGGKESLPLRSLIRQILLVAHQGSAARSCASFDPDLRVSGTGLISAPAQR